MQSWLNITLKQRLFDQFQQECRSNMENWSNGLCYKLFTENFEFEPYLDIWTYKNRITFCKSRTGNHRLPIETGRWNGIDLGNRLCNICTDVEIGDEFHYIPQCKSLANERKLYLNQYFSRRINTLTFGELFQNKNKPKLTKLCKFIRVLLVSHISVSSKWNDVISFLLLLLNFVDHLVLSCVFNIYLC